MRLFMTLLFLCGIVLLYAKEQPRYPVTGIPEALMKDAHAVVRDNQRVFTIHSKNTASLHVLYAVTIFNASRKSFASLQVGYERLRKITSFQAHVYDAEGKLIKKLKNNEITDHSDFEGLYSDVRVKVANLAQGHYPYTVEFEYDLAYKFLYEIDGTVINPYEYVSVQKALYQLNFPEHLAPRYKTYNIDQEPVSEKNNDIVSLSWNFENIKAQKFESFSDHKKEVIRIDAAPTIFEFAGYAGNMRSWDEFGKWIASINKGRNILPEETKIKIEEITSNLNTREEKVKAVYSFLQNKTRYVSVQLGIGGYQPFEASVVDKTGYGDCKALSNYMISLLEIIDIKGYYALVFAGNNKRELQADFPGSQFNHVIVAVPNGMDTLWLECTSQTNPFGYQGNYTGDRKAMIITENGASIVNTTRYPAEVNVQSRTADVYVTSSGDAKANVKTTYSGLQYENDGLNFFITGSYDDQKKWIERNMHIPIFDINSFSMTNIKNKIPSAVVTTDLTMGRFVPVTGKRIFLTPNFMNRNTFIPEKTENRKAEIVWEMEYLDLDTIRYHLPQNMYPEFLPPDVSIINRFGEYEASFKVEEGNLLYIRKVQMNKGIFPAETYTELIDFCRSMNKADNVKLVFTSKT